MEYPTATATEFCYLRGDIASDCIKKYHLVIYGGEKFVSKIISNEIGS